MEQFNNINIYKIINYLRKSRQDIEKEKRTGEDTLATQRKIMSRVLDDLKIPYDQVPEIGSGDKIETRPVFQQVMHDVELGKYNAIAVKEIPRLGRGSYTDMGKIYDLIISKRIFIVTPYKTYDPQNSSDLRQIRFEMFLSREEFEMIKERLISAKYNLASEGKWIAGGSIPYGYKLNQQTMRLEPDEEKADVIRYIFTIYVYGLEMEDGSKKDVSFRAIATYLSRIGVPTARGGVHWNPITVQKYLSNEVYIGTVKFRQSKRIGKRQYPRPKEEHIVVELAHEPLIDKETWDLAQKKLNNRGKNMNHTPLDFSPCELAGLIRCIKCGKKMVRQYSIQHYKKKSGGESVYHKEFLWCTTPGCTYVKYRDVEKAILIYLKTLKELNKEQLKGIFDMYFSKKNEEKESLNISEIVIQKENDLKRKLNFICEKYENGIYTDQMFIERKKEIDKELESIKKINTPINNQENIDEKILKYQQDILKILDFYEKTKNKSKRNELLHSIIDYIELVKIDKGRFKIDVMPKIF